MSCDNLSFHTSLALLCIFYEIAIQSTKLLILY